MSNIDNLTPASTVTPVATTTPAIYTTQVETDTFILDKYSVDGITSDVSSADPTKLLTAYGAYKELSDIYKDIAELTSRVDHIEVLPVLSDPMLPTNFIGNDWFLYGWYIDNGKAIYLSNGSSNTDDNQVKIKTSAITEKGNYYLHIVVDRIDGGKLVVYDENNNLLGETSVIGDFKMSITVEDSSISTITIHAKDVPNGGSIILGYAGFHHVKSAFEEYIEFTAEVILSGGSGFVTKDMLEVGLENILTESKKYTNSIAGDTAKELSLHLVADNPHNITPEGIGAALENHIHSQYAEKLEVDTSITNLRTYLENLIKSSIKSAIEESAEATSELLEAHINNKNNPHNTTPELIGAALKVHQHKYTDGSLIGVAAEKHTHTPEDIEDLEETVTKAQNATEQIESVISEFNKHIDEFTLLDTKVNDLETIVSNQTSELTNIDSSLAKHLINYNNPHNTSKETIGLDKIVNGPMATDQEAIEGEADDKYMNPKNNRAVLEYYSGTSERLAQTLIPKLIMDKDITVSVNEATGRIIPKKVLLGTSGSRTYQVIMSFTGSMGDTSFTFKYNVFDPTYEYQTDDDGKYVLDDNGENIKIYTPEKDPYIQHTSLTEQISNMKVDGIVTTKDIVDETTNSVTGTEEVTETKEIIYTTIARKNNGIGFSMGDCIDPIYDLTVNTRELLIHGSCIGYRITEEEREVEEEEDIYVPEVEGDIVDPEAIVQEETTPEDTEEPVYVLKTIYRVVHGKLFGRGIVVQGKRNDVGVYGIEINCCGNANIKVYELVAAPQNPGLIADATPVGTIITRLGNVHIPGYSILDGSELLIAQHQKLYDYAVDAGLLLDKLIYDAEIINNGSTSSFGYEEGSPYFYLPKDPESTDKYYRYMKIDDLYVPTEKQLIYRYAWS